MKRTVWLCFALLAFLALPAFAHKGHHQQTQPQTQAQTQTVPSGQPGVMQPQAAPAPEEIKQLPPMMDLMFEHMHNKIVHFPIAFGLAGALFVFLGRKKSEYLAPAKILWLLAALCAVGAYFTGTSQEEPFEHTYLEETLELHENLGIATGISLWIGFLLTLSPRTKNLALVWAIVLIALISAVGFYGGVLAHAE